MDGWTEGEKGMNQSQSTILPLRKSSSLGFGGRTTRMVETARNTRVVLVH